MVWARLDDEILDNEKISRAGVLGFALHVAAITWSCRMLTDGFIPRAKARLLLDFSALPAEIHHVTQDGATGGALGDPLDLAPVDVDLIAAELIGCGLWLRDEDRDGYVIHDFLEYNPSREKVLSERERGKARAEASAKHRRRPRAASAEAPPKLRRDFAPASDGPVPDPVPDRDQDPPLTRARGDRPGYVSPDLPIAADAEQVWERETATKPAGKPIAEVWTEFVNHFATQDFLNRAALMGRWGNWVKRQCTWAAKDRQKSYELPRAGPRAQRQPHDQGWVARMKKNGTGGDL